MLAAYERRLILSYLSNAASRLHHRSPEARALADWITANDDWLALTGRTEKPCEPQSAMDYERRLPAQEWRRLQTALQGECSATKRTRGDRTAQRLRHLGRAMRLSRTDTAILEFMLRYRTQPIIKSIVDSMVGSFRWGVILANMREGLSCFLGVSANAIFSRLAPDAPLVKSGLIFFDDNGNLRLINRLNRLHSVSNRAGSDVQRLLLDAVAPSELQWSDFGHVAEDRDHVERMLKGALRAGESGVNVLLYGPPGTGKTEFCKVLAARLGVTLYSVGELDEGGDEPHRRERLQQLQLAHNLLASGHGAILLFDEMEDLLGDTVSGWSPFAPPGFPCRAKGSKVFMNRLLEQAAVPTLWTSNAAPETCPTILRRMMFALELRQPPPRVRARIWARQLAQHGIEAGEDHARALATEFNVTPGVASGATAAARLGGGDIDAVRRNVRSLCRVMGCEKPPQGPPERFDPALIRADVDPVRLAERLAGSGNRRFSLCLQGPPGTGKSAYVRHLAERLGLEVVQKRASDLMSKWVGETEQKIAAAFAEARAAQSFLVFDEADSLLADRRFAVRTWEVSQVNEMLTWMESHPLPFACTTNFGEHLDPATLRRFTFKIMLDYLAPEQTMAALPRLLRPHPAVGSRPPPRPDSRRLRCSPQKSRNPRPPAEPEGARRPAARGVRSQAGASGAGGLSEMRSEAD